MKIHLDVYNLSIKKCIGFMCNLSINGVPQIVSTLKKTGEHLD